MTEPELSDSPLGSNYSQVIPRVTINIPMPEGAAPPAPSDSQRASDEARHTEALQSYEAALSAMQERKFAEAILFLQEVVAGPSRQLAYRATIHLDTCMKHIGRSAEVSDPRTT
jgi:hypothetical protein